MTFAGIAQMNDINTVSIKTLVTFIGVFNTHSFSEVARREGGLRQIFHALFNN